MRTKIMLVLLGFILISLNYSIYQKEQFKKHGEAILLRLAPLDPRSLMQGDYMNLRYALEATANKHTPPNSAEYIVILPDENNVARFVRFHEGELLAINEKLLRFHEGSRDKIRPDTFLFQEGHAKYYENAKYGVFRFDDSGEPLLTHLADRNRQIIQVQ